MKFDKQAKKLYEKLHIEEENGEVKFYRKREVYPPFTQDGKIIWKNFLIGNWKTLAITFIIVAVTLGVIWEYITNVKVGAECIARENAKNLTNFLIS